MTGRSAALAIFVKTPGLSPIKTRLAAGIGREGAMEFYHLALDAVKATATRVQSTNVIPYWAVAELDGLTSPAWQHFRCIWQGTGDLGDRLAYVFACLSRSFERVVAIGVDSPQITPQLIDGALHHLSSDVHGATHVLGRCHDGGFYLVGANHPPPPETWHDVPYSTAAAADTISAKLVALGGVAELERLTDVDHATDLHVLLNELSAIENPSPRQLALLEWLATMLGLRT